MFQVIRERFRQGFRTIAFPDAPPVVPERLRGLPQLQTDTCNPDCNLCAQACPLDCIQLASRNAPLRLDMGRCVFCGDCARACPNDAIQFTTDYRLAARNRGDLVLTGSEFARAEALGAELRSLFGRSFKLRQVSAGGCNGCEVDINVLSVPVFDLGRFGIQIVASPRHADGLIVTGPVSENMRTALLQTYDAVAAPKVVIACGACAIAGGPYRDHPQVHNGAGTFLPVDLYIPGCPPHPITILDALLRLLGRAGD